MDTHRGGGEDLAAFEREYYLLERGDAFDSRAVPHRPPPGPAGGGDAEAERRRLREYRDSALESLEFQLFSPAPIHPELERAKLAGSLTFLAENLGGEHPLVVKVLAGNRRPPARRS